MQAAGDSRSVSISTRTGTQAQWHIRASGSGEVRVGAEGIEPPTTSL